MERGQGRQLKREGKKVLFVEAGLKTMTHVASINEGIGREWRKRERGAGRGRNVRESEGGEGNENKEGNNGKERKGKQGEREEREKNIYSLH